MDAIAGLLLSAIVLCFLTAFTGGTPTQNATKVGQIARVADEGILCKTTTVLITGKFGGGELTVTVPKNNKQLLDQIHHYNDTQEQIKITYQADLIEFSCSNETSNRMLDSVEPHPDGVRQDK